MAISAVLTVFSAPYGIDQTMSRMWLRGKLAWGAGTYAAGGVLPVAPPYLDASGAAVLIPTLNVLPDELTFKSISGSGYVYQRNNSTGKIQIFESSAGSISGLTASAPALTMNSYTPAGTNSSATPPIFTGTAAVLTGSVAAPVISGGSAASAPFAELPNGALPAGVLADVIEWVGTWVKA
jgi:hypothetical protein